MLERIKPLTALVDEMLDQLPQDMWIDPTKTFLDPAMGGGQFLAGIERRLRAAGHSDENIKSRVFGFEYNLGLVHMAISMNKLVATCRKMAYDEYFKWDGDGMKFDCIVGNPPYQDKKGNENSTNSTDLYTKFVIKSIELCAVDGYFAIVIPSAWTGPKSSVLKKILFEEHQPMLFATNGKKWFDVIMNTCYFITQLNRKGVTTIIDANRNSVSITLNKKMSIPSNLENFAIQQKLLEFARKNNLSKRWVRGTTNLNDILSIKGTDIEFICAVGNKLDKITTTWIRSGYEMTGYGIHKLVIPNVGQSDSIGNIKFADLNQVGGHSVVFLTANSSIELQRLKVYLESKIIKFLIAATKISTPNSKALFTSIPEIDLSVDISEEELYKYFSLTQEEINYIKEKC